MQRVFKTARTQLQDLLLNFVHGSVVPRQNETEAGEDDQHNGDEGENGKIRDPRRKVVAALFAIAVLHAHEVVEPREPQPSLFHFAQFVVVRTLHAGVFVREPGIFVCRVFRWSHNSPSFMVSACDSAKNAADSASYCSLVLSLRVICFLAKTQFSYALYAKFCVLHIGHALRRRQEFSPIAPDQT